jgi:8-oxo-dGTP pyrophosphatase MutT (NUDIX family)
MSVTDIEYVPKACAYVTRNGGGELLVFQGPNHEGWEIPKGTIEPGEAPRLAVEREVAEESGIEEVRAVRALDTDVWTRRAGERKYVRHFFHVPVEEQRDRWVHTVTSDGAERSQRFRFEWVDLPTTRQFALSLNDHLDDSGRIDPSGE